VLVAEDDQSLGEVLARGLRDRGYVVDLVQDGEAALGYTRCYEYCVAVVNWGMPRLSGLDLVHRLRKRGTQVPVLLLSGKATAADRVAGLDAGADDFLVKPFDFGELLARLRALQRRPPEVKSPVLTVGDVAYDMAAREAWVGEGRLALTATELGILEVLMRHSPATCARRVIAQHVWSDDAGPLGSNTIDVHVARVRAKLSGAATRIETVRGIGYRLTSHR
jgi:two-component system, OmpR family, response regulator